MTDADAFLKRIVLVVAVSALSMVNVAYAHGGKGTGGSSGGGSTSSGASSGSGHSTSSTSGGHSVASTANGHAPTASKGTHSATDPTQSGVNARTINNGRGRVFIQPGHGSGYNSQNTGNAEPTQRKKQHLLFGFIRY